MAKTLVNLHIDRRKIITQHMSNNKNATKNKFEVLTWRQPSRTGNQQTCDFPQENGRIGFARVPSLAGLTSVLETRAARLRVHGQLDVFHADGLVEVLTQIGINGIHDHDES